MRKSFGKKTIYLLVEELIAFADSSFVFRLKNTNTHNTYKYYICFHKFFVVVVENPNGSITFLKYSL